MNLYLLLKLIELLEKIIHLLIYCTIKYLNFTFAGRKEIITFEMVLTVESVDSLGKI